MFDHLHGEAESVLNVLSILTHGVVATNEPQNHDLMKSVLIEACFKMEAILAVEDAIREVFGNGDPSLN